MQRGLVAPASSCLLSTTCAPPPPPPQPRRATIEQIWQHPWLRGGLARRSVVPGVNVLVPAHSGSTEQRLDQDPFAETVQPEMVQKAYASDSKVGG